MGLGGRRHTIRRMSEGVARADIVVPLLSAAYLGRQGFTGDEWTAVFRSRKRLVLLRIEEVTPPDIFGPLLYRDLCDKLPEDARRGVLQAVRGKTGPPSEAPTFPGPDTNAAQHLGPRPRLPGVLLAVWNVLPRSPAFVSRDQLLADLRDQLSTDQLDSDIDPPERESES